MRIPNLRQALVDATPEEERDKALMAVRQVLRDLRGGVTPPPSPATDPTEGQPSG